ncbi:MAG: DNA adenine methylase, partial [Treponema sp.]|nr:DNA adenine methylase [Treponema sp.]
AAGASTGATVFDGFSGSTRVSQAYAKSGYTVYANDIAPYAKVFNTAFLLNTREPASYAPLIDHLNSLAPVDGWFTEHYGGDGEHRNSDNGDGFKKPWQKKNTRKLDAIREEIDALDLDEITRAVALASLMLALDQVDSTLGHYASYLHEWSRRSYNDLKLETPRVWVNTRKNVVMTGDVFKALEELPGVAIAYFDPPYGSNNEKMPPSRVRYASYYHIWTTVCLNDRPEIFGKAKRRVDSSDRVAGSVFEEFRRGGAGKFIAVEAIEKLIKRSPADYIVLSYSSGGRAAAHELYETLAGYGRILEIVKVNYKKNVMAAMKWTRDWVKEVDNGNVEYVFLMEKT